MCSDNAEPEIESPSRTPHPPNGMIRKTPPTTISADTIVVVKKKKTTSPGQSKHCIHVGDFDQMTKSLTEDCIAIYCAQIGAVQPFPVNRQPASCGISMGGGMQELWSSNWPRRFSFQGGWQIFYTFNPLTNISLFQVTDRASQIRSQVKTITKTHLFAAYGIDDVNDSQCEVHNKIEQLLEDFQFVYKVCCLYSIFPQSHFHFRTLRRRRECIWPHLYRWSSTIHGSEMQRMMVLSTQSSPMAASCLW